MLVYLQVLTQAEAAAELRIEGGVVKSRRYRCNPGGGHAAPPESRLYGGPASGGKGRVREEQVTKLADGIFYAAAIKGAVGSRTVGAPPSGAMSLALLMEAPVQVAASVLAAVIPPDIQKEREASLYAEDSEGAPEIVRAALNQMCLTVEAAGTAASRGGNPRRHSAVETSELRFSRRGVVRGSRPPANSCRRGS